MAMRIKPRVLSKLYAAYLPLSVETSILWLQFEPSIGRKIGSVPCVCRNLNSTFAAETDMPSLGWWHVPHVRPFVPMLWKNGPVRSMPPPLVLYVCEAPFGFGKNTPFGMNEKIPVSGLLRSSSGKGSQNCAR